MRGDDGVALGSIGCHSAQMSSSQAITATCTLSSAAYVEQVAGRVREVLGSSAVIEQDDGAVLVARFGSRTAYRLLGMWAKNSWVPMRVRFVLAAQDSGTQVTVRMSSDQGGGYLAITSLAHQHYRVRFDALVADLERTGLTLTEPVHQ